MAPFAERLSTLTTECPKMTGITITLIVVLVLVIVCTISSFCASFFARSKLCNSVSPCPEVSNTVPTVPAITTSS